MNINEINQKYGNENWIYVYCPEEGYKVKLESFMKVSEDEYWVTLPNSPKVILNKENINKCFKDRVLRVYVEQNIEIED